MSKRSSVDPSMRGSRWQRLSGWVWGLLRDAGELVLPQTCVCRLCRRPLPAPPLPFACYVNDLYACLCRECIHSLAWVQPPLCPQCGRPWRHGGLCRFCLRRRHVLQGCSPLVYTGAAQELVRELKFRAVCELGRPLGYIIGAMVRSAMPDWEPQAIIPVPLHADRLAARGYNQAELLSQGVSHFLKKPLLHQALLRTRHTQPQSALSVTERVKNVHAAFHVPHPAVVANKRLLLVDDVHTTGATVHAAASALWHAGATTVRFATLAVAANTADLSER
jgi:ComF family protein